MEGVAPGSPFVPVLQEYALLAEYKLAQKHAPRGVYVAVHPSGAWDGSVFVHSGPFQGGSFRFRMLIPDRHPTQTTPRVFFQTTVYHPQVNPDTGELSTARHFPRWRPEKDKLWHLLKLIKHIFYSPSAKEPVFNRDAATALTTDDGKEFTRLAQECAKESETIEPCNNVLRFEERFDDRGTKRLADLMLKWGENEDASIAATLDFFEAAAVSDKSPQQAQATNLRDAIRAKLNRQADTADTTLSKSKCKGFLSLPDDAGWQRRWAVLTYPPGIGPDDDLRPPGQAASPPRPSPVSPRTPTSSKRRQSSDKPPAAFTLVFYEDKTETKRVEEFDCGQLCRAYQPAAAEMKSNNTFLVVLPGQVLKLQAPSNNAVQVWLHALTL